MAAVHNSGDQGHYEKVHACTICPSVFARAKLLDEHYRKKHDSMKPHTAIENDLDGNEVVDRLPHQRPKPKPKSNVN